MLTYRTTLIAGLMGLGLTGTASAGGSGDAVIGAVIGAGLGAAVGHQVDGRPGALIGSAIGAVAGTAISTNDRDDRRYRDTRYQPGYSYVEPVRYQPAPVIYQPARVVYRQPVYVAPAYYAVRAYAPPRPVMVNYRYRDNDGWRGNHGRDRDDRRGYRDRNWD